MYPTAVSVTPLIWRNAASTPQKHPAPNVACSIILVYVAFGCGGGRGACVTVTPRCKSSSGNVSEAGRRNEMCDYSLHTYPNRLAADGEGLVVHRFGAGSLGLASPADLDHVISAAKATVGLWPQVKAWFEGRNLRWEAEKRVPAVCIPPGARLILFDIPKSLQRELGVGPVEEVQFVQTTAEV